MQIAESGTKTQAEYLASIRQGKAQEECLVDAWIGHARYVDIMVVIFISSLLVL